MNEQINKNKHLIYFDLLVKIVIVLTVLCLFVPFSPEFPAESLDPSWRYGMNEVVAQGMALGRDVIFTFGPYASIYTKTYHPETDRLVMLGAIYLALSFSTLLCFVVSRLPRDQSAITLLSLIWLMFSIDALFFCFPIVVWTVASHIRREENLKGWRMASIAILIVAFAPLGLLPLVKGSFLISSAAIAFISIFMFLLSSQRRNALVAGVSPIIAMIVFWIISGQSLDGLFRYFQSMMPIVSGYTEAMAVDGNNLEIIFYIFASLLILFGLWFAKNISPLERIANIAVYFVFLFLAFKAGFVRHDGHALMASTAIAVGTVLFSFSIASRVIAYAMVALAFSFWLYVDGHYMNSSWATVRDGASSIYKAAWRGLVIRIEEPEAYDNDFNRAVSNLNTKGGLPLLEGTSDIYSFNQSYLIASGNKWSPRPVFQSYSAYTPVLDKLNRDYLLSDRAPDNIFFRVEPLDGRYPSTEDGPSWEPLLKYYDPVAMANDFLILKKLSSTRNNEGLAIEKKIHAALGKRIEVPIDSGIIFAQLDVKRKFFGKIIDLFFKPSALKITVSMLDGSSKTFNFISGMAKSGFVISPLIESTQEFGLLYGAHGYLDSKKVVSFIVHQDSNRHQWNKNFDVVFRKLDVPPRSGVSKLYDFERIIEVDQSKVSIQPVCEGNFDYISGANHSRSSFVASGLLTTHGWLAKSTAKGTLPDAVMLVLEDIATGHRTFIETKRTPRSDIAAGFKHASLGTAGFASVADVASIEGRANLGLAYVDGGNVKICANFNIPGLMLGASTHR